MPLIFFCHLAISVLLVLHLTNDLSWISLPSALTKHLLTSPFKNVKIIIIFLFLAISPRLVSNLGKVSRPDHVTHVLSLVGLLTLLSQCENPVLVPLTAASLAGLCRLSAIFISYILSDLSLINLFLFFRIKVLLFVLRTVSVVSWCSHYVRALISFHIASRIREYLIWEKIILAW